MSARALAAISLLLAACAGASADASANASTDARARAWGPALVPPPGEVLFGAFATMDETELDDRFDELAAHAGKAPALRMIFRDWPSDGRPDFPVRFARAARAAGAVAMVTWEPWWDYSHERYPLLDDIADGAHDAFIRGFLEQAADFGEPWFLRFAHEMEDDFYPWTTGFDRRQSAASYVAAFRRVAALAREIAPRTLMVWSPNGGSRRARARWPGDDVVDWIGGSLYSFPDAPQDPDHDDKLGGWVPMVRRYAKPAMIAEMGCSEPRAGEPARLARWMDPAMRDKTRCLERTFDVIEARYPEIRALVWFDIDKDADWRVASSESARRVFARRLADPRYLGAPLAVVPAPPPFTPPPEPPR